MTQLLILHERLKDAFDIWCTINAGYVEVTSNSITLSNDFPVFTEKQKHSFARRNLGNVCAIRRNADGVVLARQRFIRGPVRMISILRTYRAGKYQVSEIYTRVWKPRERKKETRARNRCENPLDSRCTRIRLWPSSFSSLFLSSLRLLLSSFFHRLFFSFFLPFLEFLRSEPWSRLTFLPVLRRRAFIGLASTHLPEVTPHVAFPCEVARSSRPSLI